MNIAMNIALENESPASIGSSPDATFQRGTLDTRCGTFSAPAMHSTSHPSEPNYIARESGLNATVNARNDGFLVERDAVGGLVRETVALADRVGQPC